MIEQTNCIDTNIRTLQSVSDPAPGYKCRNARQQINEGDAINKRKSDAEPNAIKFGWSPHSTCFFLCSTFFRNQKVFHGLASSVV